MHLRARPRPCMRRTLQKAARGLAGTRLLYVRSYTSAPEPCISAKKPLCRPLSDARAHTSIEQADQSRHKIKIVKCDTVGSHVTLEVCTETDCVDGTPTYDPSFITQVPNTTEMAEFQSLRILAASINAFDASSIAAARLLTNFAAAGRAQVALQSIYGPTPTFKIPTACSINPRVSGCLCGVRCAGACARRAV